jgi:HAE1 family hydrophobic/amphiphilic exporter-1
MQKIAEICIRRPVFATMLILFLVVMGLDSYRKLGVDFFPKVEFPIVTVTTALRGAAPEEVESQVTKRIEEAVNTVSGIDDLSSISSEGVSLVSIQFVLTKDPDVAAQEVRDKVARVVSQLPPDADQPVVDKLATDAAPILNVVVSSPRDLRETTKLVDDRIKKSLETLPGVGQVRFVGERQRQVHVLLDTDRMFAYGLNVDQVRASLAAQNVEVPGGRIDLGPREMSVRTLGRVSIPKDFERVIVANVSGSPVRISDIASVEDAFEEPRSLARLDGKPAVLLEVRKQAGTNTLDVINSIKSRIGELRAYLPPDFAIAYSRDQSRFISESFEAVEEHLVLGGFLAALIVLAFIRSWRSTVIAAVAIPASIISTYSLMKWMDFTLNQITMLGLVLMVGIVIDDAIVVLENIFRFMEEKHLPPLQAAVQGTRDIGLAVMATTLSLVIIFLPVAFMEGIVGRFMSSFGFTAAFAVMVSLLVSFTLTPMLCSRFLSRESEHGATKDTWLFLAVSKPYRALLNWSMRHRWVIVGICFAVMASSAPLFMLVGKDFLPQDDQSQYEVIVRTPPGSSLAGTDAIIQQVESELRQLPGTRNLISTVGADLQRRVDRGSVIVEMTQPEERKETQFQIMALARERLKKFRDVTIAVQLPSLISGAENRQLMFYVQGPDLDRLEKYSTAVRTKLAAMPGVVDLDTNYEPGKPELRVQINRDRAADVGVNVGSIAGAVRTLVGGDEQVTTYREGDDRYDVMLRVKEEYRRSAATLDRLFVPSSVLGNVPLSNVARLEPSTGPTQISRYNRNRQVLIMANIAQGQSLSNVLAELERTTADLKMPPDYRTGLIGQSKEFGRATQAYAFAFGLSIVLMYMVLAAQFESFVDPITILLSLPLSVPFALLSLLVARENYSIIYSSVGIFVLFGIVKKNSILQIDHIKSLRAEGVARADAILRGCEDRLRPILMTTAALVAGMIPMALGGGAGSGSRRTVAIVVIGGQSLCLLLTLLVTPVTYSLFDDLAHWSLWGRIGRFLSGLSWRRAWASASGLFMSLLLVAISLPAQTLEVEPARAGVGETRTKLALRDAIAMAIENNLELEVERANINMSEQLLNAARGAFDGVFKWNPSGEARRTPTGSILISPTGRLEESYHYQNFGWQQRIPGQGTSLQLGFDNAWQSTNNPFTALSPYTIARLYVNLVQPIVKNRKIDRERTEILVRRKSIDTAESDFEIRLVDVVGRVERSYWNLVAARQDVFVTSEGMRLGREQLARTQRQIEAGTLAPVELSAAEAELQRRIDTYHASVNLLSEAENSLKTLITGGHADDIWKAAIVPADERGENGEEPSAELDTAISEAVKRRPELRSILYRRETATIQKESAADQLKPQVNLVFGYSAAGLAGSVSQIESPFLTSNAALYGRVNQLSGFHDLVPLSPPSGGGIPPGLEGGYGQTLSNLFGGNNQSFAGGVSIEWNPRNRTAKSNLEQAVISERRLDLQKRQLEQQIAVQVRTAVQNIETAKQRILAAEASARAAQEKLDSEVRLFQTGESTNFLVLTRQNELFDSRRRVVFSHLELNRALSGYRLARGTALDHYQIRPR